MLDHAFRDAPYVGIARPAGLAVLVETGDLEPGIAAVDQAKAVDVEMEMAVDCPGGVSSLGGDLPSGLVLAGIAPINPPSGHIAKARRG